MINYIYDSMATAVSRGGCAQKTHDKRLTRLICLALRKLAVVTAFAIGMALMPSFHGKQPFFISPVFAECNGSSDNDKSVLTCDNDNYAGPFKGGSGKPIEVTLKNESSITTTTSPYGIEANHASSAIILLEGKSSINARSNFAKGIYTGSDSIITLKEESSITATGTGGTGSGVTTGVEAGGNAKINLNNSTITSKGPRGANGIQINQDQNDSAEINLTNSTIHAIVVDDDAYSGKGIYVHGNGSSGSILLDNSHITIVGSTNAYGIELPSVYPDAIFKITLKNESKINVEGDSSYAIKKARNLTLDATSELTSQDNTALDGTDFIDEYTIDGVVSGGGGIAISTRKGDDIINLQAGAKITGKIDGGNGDDTLTLAGIGGVIDYAIVGFEVFTIEEEASWRIASGIEFYSTTNQNRWADIELKNNSLQIDGKYAGNMIVNENAVLAGMGEIFGDVTNNSSSTLKLQSSDGLKIFGKYTQAKEAGLIFVLDGSHTTDPILQVESAVDLNGTFNIEISQSTTNYEDGITWTLVNSGAGGINGDFSNLRENRYVEDNSDIYDFFLSPLLEDSTSLVLTLKRSVPFSETPGLNGNGLQVANYLDDLFAGGELSDLQSTLSDVDEDKQLNYLISQSGEIGVHSMEAAANMMSVNGATALSRVTSSSDVRLAVADDAIETQTGFATGDQAMRQWTVWIEGNGGFGHLNGDQQARGYDYQRAGFAMGIESDDILTKHDRLGIFYAWGQSKNDIDKVNETSSDAAQSTLHQIGIYGGYTGMDSLELAGTLSLGYATIETSRNTNVTGIATGSSDGYSLGFSGELAWNNDWIKEIGIKPLIGLEGGYIHINAYDETGAGDSNLNIKTDDTIGLKALAGIRFGAHQSLNHLLGDLDQGWKIYPIGKIAVAHQVLDTQSSTKIGYVATPDAAPHTAQSIEKATTSLKLNLNMEIAKGMSDDFLIGYVDYNGEAASNFQDHTVTIGFKIKW